MNMIGHDVPFYYFYLLPFSEFFQDFPQPSANLAIKGSLSVLGNNDHVVFAFPSDVTL